MKKLDIVQHICKDKIVTLTESIATAGSKREARDTEMARVILKTTQKGREELLDHA